MDPLATSPHLDRGRQGGEELVARVYYFYYIPATFPSAPLPSSSVQNISSNSKQKVNNFSLKNNC